MRVATIVPLALTLASCERERPLRNEAPPATTGQRTLSGNLVGVTTIEDTVGALERDGDHCEPATRDELRHVRAEHVPATVVEVCVGGRLLPGRRLIVAAARAGAPILVYGVHETEADLATAARKVADYLKVFEHVQGGPAHRAVGGVGADGQLARGAEVRRGWSYGDLDVAVWATDRGDAGFDIGYRYVVTTTP